MSIPHITGIIEANNALKAIRKQIERDPVIDVTDPSGLELQGDSELWKPSFRLENVTFAYPTRANVKALDNVSLECPAGKFTAIVGPSGSGKSTVASLLLREYDPETANVAREVDLDIKRHFEQDEQGANGQASEEKRDKQVASLEEDRIQGAGCISFAGHDLRTLNLRWLRTQVAVVSQNPQLFAGSILDNVASGLTGTRLQYRPDSAKPDLLAEIRERCEEALKKAQAWEFVRELANGMDEVILGGRTGVLSGGQLQRVALARAFVSRPRCLLLDEATSAVASDAELKITDILLEEQRTRGLTLIVVAHRLSSIAKADNIIVMKAGKIVNQGSYQQLVDPANTERTFFNMVNVKHLQEGKKRLLLSNSSSQTDVSPVSSELPAIQPPRVLPMQTSEPLVVLGPPMRKSTAIFGMNKWLLLAGTLGSAIGGGAFVISGWLTGNAVSSLSIPDDNARMRSEMNRWSLWFLVVALGVLVAFFVGGWTLEWAGTNIKHGLKRESLRAVLRQDTAFFETDQGGSGTLTSGISSHPSAVGQTVGVIWLQIVVALANLIGAFVLGFILSWRVAIIGLPAILLAIVAGYFNFTWLEEFESLVGKESEKRSNQISEAVNSIRTIASLTREGEVLWRFKAAAVRSRQQRLALMLGSVGFGIAQGSTFLFGAFVFWWGARLVSRSEVVSRSSSTRLIMRTRALIAVVILGLCLPVNHGPLCDDRGGHGSGNDFRTNPHFHRRRQSYFERAQVDSSKSRGL
jgi:ATP-binding cassette subfamily B (MDR/TAP) protein 1